MLGRMREGCCSGCGEVLHYNLSNGSWALTEQKEEMSKSSITVTFVPVWEENGGQLLQILQQSCGIGIKVAIKVVRTRN